MKKNKKIFPFTAIVGQEKMKKALILNAINPKIGGVLIQGQKGTAKSTAARSLVSLLNTISVVKNCPYNCNPYNESAMCYECLKKKKDKEKFEVQEKKINFVDLPLGSTEDRVIGTLNIEHAIKEGKKLFEPGLLAKANRGILYIDEVNLLDDHLVDVLLDSSAMGINYIQREGISYYHPSKFILIGTMNPEEGELRPQLIDRFGLCVEVEGVVEKELRVEIINRFISFEENPNNFITQYYEKEKELSNLILNAKSNLLNVTYDNEILTLIASISLEMGVDGHRSDITMLKTAKTIAAYHGNKFISENDVSEAAELVLKHRMRRLPFEEQKMDKEKIQTTINNNKKKTQNLMMKK
jgi:Mg-chelatase subunit ChlI